MSHFLWFTVCNIIIMYNNNNFVASGVTTATLTVTATTVINLYKLVLL